VTVLFGNIFSHDEQ